MCIPLSWCCHGVVMVLLREHHTLHATFGRTAETDVSGSEGNRECGLGKQVC